MSIDAVARVAELVAHESGMVIGLPQRGSLVTAIAQMAPGMTAEGLLAEGCTGGSSTRSRSGRHSSFGIERSSTQSIGTRR
jgi:hypothetical protein